ncbi:MAG: hypothetical protein NVS4B7_16510 [Ktedonobacteraceae bacterium]
MARPTRLNDAQSVAELLTVCDTFADDVSLHTEEDIVANWRKPGFNLATDAWVIVTNKGQFVGYADISHSEHAHIHLQACVHPSYQSRGIGTLLLRLAEVRARQHIKHALPAVRVTLSNTINSANRLAQDLLEHEGYSFVRHFWRIVIQTNEDHLPSLNASQLQPAQHVVLDVSYPCVTGKTQIYEPSGLYIVRQYTVYEKELRAGAETEDDEILHTQLMMV